MNDHSWQPIFAGKPFPPTFDANAVVADFKFDEA
jgi:hypothetical protein